jgi:hypothetical protein
MKSSIIDDWPEYRAWKIAGWERELDSLLAQREKEKSPGKRSDLDAVIEGVIADIDNYRCQQETEGH